MSASPSPREVFDALSASLRRIADAVDTLAVDFAAAAPASGLRLVPPAVEELLTIDEAATVLGGVSHDTVRRMTKGKPCRRRVGRRSVRYERAGLLALTRRG